MDIPHGSVHDTGTDVLEDRANRFELEIVTTHGFVTRERHTFDLSLSQMRELRADIDDTLELYARTRTGKKAAR